jgi:hypothetical protein
MCRRLTRFFTALLCGLCLARGTSAPASPAAPITQHRINELAAALETARLNLIENTGLRRPGESLAAYLDRVVMPLPGESRPAYQARCAGYLTALAHAAAATASARRMPRLRDSSPANHQRWERATDALSYLPTHLDRLRAAWRHPPERNSPPPRALVGELRACLNFVIAALADLRDAYP